MKKFVLAGVAAAALLAVPALAVKHGGEHPAQPMTRAAVQAKVQARFAAVDANRDNFISQSEIESRRAAARAERQAGRAERRAALFAKLDADRDGAISKAEFAAPRAAPAADRAERRGHRMERRAERRAHRMERRSHRVGFGMRAFARLDADKDSRLSLAEATAGALQRFDRIDANRDGTITRDERKAARADRHAKRG